MQQILDMPIHVEAKITDQKLQPERITWQQRAYTVVAVGRQWLAEDGRHVLIEVHDGSRMEVRLDTNFVWRLLRYWPAVTVV